MLRITPIRGSSGLCLKLEGKLLSPWIGELRAACIEFAEETSQPRLDLAEISFVDAAGIQLLDELRNKGFLLAPCSNFVSTVLRTEAQR